MKKHDGLKLMLHFYDNFGLLKQVTERSGVPTRRLKAFLKGKELPEKDREILENIMLEGLKRENAK